MSHYRYTIDELKEIKKTMTVDEDFEKKVDLFFLKISSFPLSLSHFILFIIFPSFILLCHLGHQLFPIQLARVLSLDSPI